MLVVHACLHKFVVLHYNAIEAMVTKRLANCVRDDIYVGKVLPYTVHTRDPGTTYL